MAGPTTTPVNNIAAIATLMLVLVRVLSIGLLLCCSVVTALPGGFSFWNVVAGNAVMPRRARL